MMTKIQEIEHLDRMIEQTPVGYLKALLLHLKPQFKQDTFSDFLVLPDLHQLNDDVHKAHLELSHVCSQVRQAQNDLERAEAEERRTMGRIDRLRQEAKELAAKFELV